MKIILWIITAILIFLIVDYSEFSPAFRLGIALTTAVPVLIVTGVVAYLVYFIFKKANVALWTWTVLALIGMFFMFLSMKQSDIFDQYSEHQASLDDRRMEQIKEIVTESTNRFMAEQKAVKESFEEEARMVNKYLPAMVDEHARWDKVTVGPGNRVSYDYSFPKHTSSEIDPALLHDNLFPAVQEEVCNTEELKLSLRYGWTLVYSYVGSDGLEIISFEIDRNDCEF